MGNWTLQWTYSRLILKVKYNLLKVNGRFAELVDSPVVEKISGNCSNAKLNVHWLTYPVSKCVKWKTNRQRVLLTFVFLSDRISCLSNICGSY